jgi:integrase
MEGKGTRLKLRGGIYYVVWTGNSRGTSTRTGSRPAAEQFLATFIQERDKQDAVTGVGLTVSQILDDYIIEYVRPKNVVSRQQIEIARHYFNVHFPVGTLAISVTEDDIDAYVAARRAGRLKITRDPKPAGDGTIRRELGTLMAAYNHAIRKKRLAPGSAPYIDPPPRPPARDLWLDAEQEKTLLAAMPQPAEGDGRLTRIYRFVMLAMDTAARKEALETLTWFQIDFGANTINFNPRDRIQTRKRRAVVPMSARLRAMLERAYREKESGYVLDHPGSIRACMRTLRAKAKMPWVTPHVFRHTWATRAARAGVEMVDIADFLGDDLRTVEKNYRHQSPHFLKGVADWREREVR